MFKNSALRYNLTLDHTHHTHTHTKSQTPSSSILFLNKYSLCKVSFSVRAELLQLPSHHRLQLNFVLKTKLAKSYSFFFLERLQMPSHLCLLYNNQSNLTKKAEFPTSYKEHQPSFLPHILVRGL
ncbi:hypothetical protein OAV88_01425 [bacterium]|nr:hypothetical protein [bacterium]